MKAWQDPIGTIRDVAQGDPFAIYHPNIAALYTTDVPDGTVNGATLVNLVWVNPVPAPVPPPVPLAPIIPDEVPMASARIILLRAGITAAMVTNAINADVTTTSAQKAEALIDFEFRTTVRRNSALSLALGPALGLTSAQMDAMFVQASAL